MRFRLFGWLFVAMTLLLTSCGDAESEFSKAPCYVVIDNATHQDATLATAMNATSPGIFCIVKKTVKSGGAAYFSFTNNEGQHSDKLYTAIDSRRTLIFGLSNGIIVGFGNLSSPATFYAYDLQCPNCFDPQALPLREHPLTLETNGLARCTLCKREYNLNTGGIVAKGDGGKKLTRYYASTAGPFGVLQVN